MTNEVLKVGGLSAGPGEKAAGIHVISVDGANIDTPVFLINGAQDGPTLAVTAGVHGAEFASIEAALQLGRTLRPEDVRGRVIVVPIANVPAFRATTVDPVEALRAQ